MWNLWKRKISLEEQMEISLEEQMIQKIVESTYDGTLLWECKKGGYLLHKYHADRGNIRLVWSPCLGIYHLSINKVIVCMSYRLLSDVHGAILSNNPVKEKTIQSFLDRFTSKPEAITTEPCYPP